MDLSVGTIAGNSKTKRWHLLVKLFQIVLREIQKKRATAALVL